MPEGEIQDLTIFVGPSSWSLLTIIGCNGEFLNKPPSAWASDEEYVAAKEIIDNLLVVNDAAERGVKLCHDFLNSAKSEHKFQDILQVVQNDRATRPNL